MSRTERQLDPRLWGILIALTTLTAFLFYTLETLLIFIAVATYFLWSLHVRIRHLEERLSITRPTSSEKPQP